MKDKPPPPLSPFPKKKKKAEEDVYADWSYLPGFPVLPSLHIPSLDVASLHGNHTRKKLGQLQIELVVPARN